MAKIEEGWSAWEVRTLRPSWSNVMLNFNGGVSTTAYIFYSLCARHFAWDKKIWCMKDAREHLDFEL